MELSIVIGAYQFIGFHLCKFLLEQGYEVLGVDWDKDPTPDSLIEEKQLEFGRNSNFHFMPIHELQKFPISNQTTIYICLYDYIKGNASGDGHMNKAFQEMLHALPVADRTVFLYPLGLTGEEIKALKISKDPDKIIYLPTIYGPWQHDTMAFEQGVRGRGKAEIKAALEKEYKLDAIFVTDFLDCLDDILNHSEKTITIKSSKPNQWSLCARELFESDTVYEEIPVQREKETGAFVYLIKNTVEPEQGVKLQKKHYKRMETIGKWKFR